MTMDMRHARVHVHVHAHVHAHMHRHMHMHMHMCMRMTEGNVIPLGSRHVGFYCRGCSSKAVKPYHLDPV